ncbi:peptidase [Alkalicoccus saliphilus]|uniref:Peptidase n=1 Tax=Alkalicoccus saliphilus TaxID=200989 RepID=A0A2T4U9L4_9BACI|nr:peptidase [Alkalicoccus saliphilus]
MVKLQKSKIVLYTLPALLVAGMATPALADSHGDENAMVRVLHASPDAPEVDVYVNGDAAVEGAAFQDITDYLELPAGDHEVAIFPAGEGGEGDPVIEETLTVEGGMNYTAAAVDTLDNLTLEAFADDNTVEEGMTKIRVGHMSPGAPAVDVGLVDGDSLFEGAEFFAVTDYLELDPDTYDLEIRAAGTEDAVLDLSGTELEADTVYSAYAVGADADELEVVLVADEAHAAPSEMPATGMGGASQSANYLPLALTILAGGLGAAFLFRKKILPQA